MIPPRSGPMDTKTGDLHPSPQQHIPQYPIHYEHSNGGPSSLPQYWCTHENNSPLRTYSIQEGGQNQLLPECQVSPPSSKQTRSAFHPDTQSQSNLSSIVCPWGIILQYLSQKWLQELAHFLGSKSTQGSPTSMYRGSNYGSFFNLRQHQPQPQQEGAIHTQHHDNGLPAKVLPTILGTSRSKVFKKTNTNAKSVALTPHCNPPMHYTGEWKYSFSHTYTII